MVYRKCKSKGSSTVKKRPAAAERGGSSSSGGPAVGGRVPGSFLRRHVVESGQTSDEDLEAESLARQRRINADMRQAEEEAERPQPLAGEADAPVRFQRCWYNEVYENFMFYSIPGLGPRERSVGGSPL